MVPLAVLLRVILVDSLGLSSRWMPKAEVFSLVCLLSRPIAMCPSEHLSGMLRF